MDTSTLLKKLVSENKVNIFFVYGTARSGTTISQIIFSSFCDLAIHEPFTGSLQNRVMLSGVNKKWIDESIYQAGCEVIAKKILTILKSKSCATILVKETSTFWNLKIWEKWSKIPDKFLFTIRDPHLQYFSRLSQITNLSNSHGSSSTPSLVLTQATLTESLDLSSVRPFFNGPITEDNQKSWQTLNCHQNQVRTAINGTHKKMAILDAMLLKKDPKYTLSQTIKQLGFKVNNIENFGKNLQMHSKDKVFDIRDPNRPTVRKARNSKEIAPLVLGEDISLYDFPPSSREHILKIIPCYLEMLYAPEQVAMPSLTQLDTPVAQSETWKLDELHPFIAYAIASFHLHQKTASAKKVFPLIQRILNGCPKNASQTEENLNSVRFRDSFERVDRYWNSQ